MSSSTPTSTPAALEIRNLQVEFDTFGGVVKAVRGVSYAVAPGQTLAVVGESGCGKSVTVQAVMGLIPRPPGRVTSGSALLKGGVDLLALTEAEARQYRARDIAMIFQDPMTSLNPTMRIGDQIAESLVVHKGMSWEASRAEAIRLLDRTRIPEASSRSRQYPFEFSGGMLQRAMIAVAVACRPAVLIADEPTTALDVTIQDQVLELMREIQREEKMAIVLITHDLGVVARMADEVAVMYAGQIVEQGPVGSIFKNSSHPYTLGLRQAMPSSDGSRTRLLPIEGSPPDLFRPPVGCGYCARCPFAMQVCEFHSPPLFDVGSGQSSACWLQHSEAPRSRDSRLHQKGKAPA